MSNDVTQDLFIWNAEVRGYELDTQGIVNNAVYLQYFDHVRIAHLLSKGIDWQQYHDQGFNIVLIHVDMELKNSLKAHDKFYVSSRIEKSGRLRIIFHQAIYTQDDRLIAKAINTVACVDLNSGKPVMPESLSKSLFTIKQD